MRKGRLKIEVQHLPSHKVLHMGTHYNHLTELDRLTIDSMLLLGHSQRSVAAALEVSPSTISREVRRAKVKGSWRYFALFGQRARAAGRKRAGRARRKLGGDLRSPCWQHVLAGLRRGWSPQQIAGRLKAMDCAANDPSLSTPYVSHETIYCAIYAQPRGTLRTELVKLLRKSHSGRLPRARGEKRFTGLQGMTSIDLRPPEVAARIVPGHWEGDLIKGARNASAVGTIVERTSRYTVPVALPAGRRDATTTCDALIGAVTGMPAQLTKTLTWDQGSEMAAHAASRLATTVDVFFAHPHSPWERGTNENTNRLLREYFPKGTEITDDQAYLDLVAHELNNRPRRILGYRTPTEVFTDLLTSGIATTS